MNTSQTVAFIGLGIMGRPMAGHLLDAGHRLIVHTRTAAKARELQSRGARWANTPAEAARQAEVVFICVNDTPDVEAVITGKGGVMDAARPGLIVVDHSTISPAATRKLAETLATKGAQLLDAPVSGGDVGAKNGTLSIMVGGDVAAFEKVQPLLGAMGKTVTHCGPLGNGQLTKLVNQILVSVTELAVCEALAFADDNGLDLPMTLAAVGAGAAGSWQLAHLGGRMISRDYRPGFMIDLQVKDLRLVEQAARDSGTSMSAVDLVHQLFIRAQQRHGRDGTAALYEIIHPAKAPGDESKV